MDMLCELHRPVLMNPLAEFQALLASGIANPARKWCPHSPFPKQKQFIDLDCTEALYGGAAGSAKSDALLQAALKYVDSPGYAAILFRRTYSDLSLPDAIMDRAHQWLDGTAAHWDGVKHQFTFPSGAKLAFGYLDGPRDHYRYKSAQFQFVGFDEESEFDPVPVMYLNSRLRRLMGSVIPLRKRGATNPGGIGHKWLMKRFKIPERPGGDIIWSEDETGLPIAFVPATFTDNPYIDRVSYEQQLAKLDPVTRAQLRDGVWVQDASALVYQFDSDRNVVDALPQLPGNEQWTKILGADFGVTDPTALVVIAFAEHDPCAYVVEAEEWPGLAPSDAGDIIREWQARHEPERSIGDFGGMGKAYEAEFSVRYVAMLAASKSDKLGNIKLINGDLANGKLKIVRAGCKRLLEQITELQWKDATHQKENPSLANHCTDAMLYAWRECRQWQATEREEVITDPRLLAAKQWQDRIAANVAHRDGDADGFGPGRGWHGRDDDGFSDR